MDNSIALNTALRSIEQCDALLFPMIRSLGAVGLDKLANEIRFIAEGIDDDIQVAKRAAEAISVERLQYSQKMVGGILNKLVSNAVKDEGRDWRSMDPEACLKALDEALDNKDGESVFEYSEALIGWLAGGGFNPFDKRIGMDWRANLTLYEIKSYLGDLSRACGSVGE